MICQESSVLLVKTKDDYVDGSLVYSGLIIELTASNNLFRINLSDLFSKLGVNSFSLDSESVYFNYQNNDFLLKFNNNYQLNGSIISGSVLATPLLEIELKSVNSDINSIIEARNNLADKLKCLA
jgi:hypothetical protein